MYHRKAIVVDDMWLSLGSEDSDHRPPRLKHEANLNVHDAAFAAEQVAVFETDKANSRRTARAEFKNRTAVEKI